MFRDHRHMDELSPIQEYPRFSRSLGAEYMVLDWRDAITKFQFGCRDCIINLEYAIEHDGAVLCQYSRGSRVPDIVAVEDMRDI